MEFLKFSSPDVEAKYQSTFKGDPLVHVPCEKGQQNGFKRKLSTITMGQAERIMKLPGQNWLQLKEADQPGAEPINLKTSRRKGQGSDKTEEGSDPS